MEYTKSKNKYFISFILIIFFESLNVFSLNHPNQIIKFLSYVYIYISIFFIIFKIEISNFSDFSKITKFLFLIILIYGLFEIFLNIDGYWVQNF